MQVLYVYILDETGIHTRIEKIVDEYNGILICASGQGYRAGMVITDGIRRYIALYNQISVAEALFMLSGGQTNGEGRVCSM